jgi:hypothetical protein
MSVTKDDLLYAAKACGIKGEYDAHWHAWRIISSIFWEPHRNEADCWRMCRQLRLFMEWNLQIVVSHDGRHKEVFHKDTGLTDMEACVLVAAQIGRAL